MADVYKKLSILLKNNFGRIGTKYLDDQLRFEMIEDIDKLPKHLQERFIDKLLDKLFKHHFSREKMRNFKLLVFSQIFGKEEARNFIFEKDYFKGKPPINFIYVFFGSELGRKIIEIEQKKMNIKDIEKEEDPSQIPFIQNSIGSVFADNKGIKDQIRYDFAKYIKQGTVNNSLVEMLHKEKPEDNEALLRSIDQYMKDNKIDNKESMRKMLEKSNLSDEKKKKLMAYLEKIRIKDIKDIKREDKRDIEGEIIDKLRRHMTLEEVYKTVSQAKKSSGVRDFVSDSGRNKSMFVNYIINNSIISSYSRQKGILIESWLKDILGIS